MKNQETKTTIVEMALKNEGFTMGVNKYLRTDGSFKGTHLCVKPLIKNSFVDSKGCSGFCFNSKGEINGFASGFTIKLKNPKTHKPLGYISKTMAQILETYPDVFNDDFAKCYELMKKDFPNLEDEDDSDVLEDEE